ncbi:MAG: hypothetical protein ACRC3J_05165 [Culicoidibacterales bacterium]
MFLTLNEIRKHKPCKVGYNKLINAMLNKDKPSPWLSRYLPIDAERKDEKLSMQFVLDAVGINDAVWTLRCFDLKKHAAQHFVIDLIKYSAKLSESCFSELPHIRSAVTIVENYVDGYATHSDFRLASASFTQMYERAVKDDETELLYAYTINVGAMLSDTITSHSINTLVSAIMNEGIERDVEVINDLHDMFMMFCAQYGAEK